MTREQVREHATRIASALDVPVEVEHSLAPHLSMRVGGAVPAFLKPRTLEDVAATVRELRQRGVPHRLLGGGSNLIADDTGLDFAVVHVAAAGGGPRWEGSRLRVAGGMTLAAVLRETLQSGMSGLEWAAGLPGTVGGAVVGNAGAFGGEIARLVREVSLLSPDGDIRTHVIQPGDFGYRASFVRPGEVVLEVVLELQPTDPSAVRAEADRVNRTRAASQPKGGHSSGCMFKNPAGAHAGQLIDACGFKGARRGGAFVSPAHANFVINDGTATAADILGLVDEVREGVREKTGVQLDLEIRVWRAGDEAAP